MRTLHSPLHSHRSLLLFLLVSAAALIPIASLSAMDFMMWQTNTQFHGVYFEKVRFGKSGNAIGWIANDEAIAGRPCRKGWVHLYPDGSLAAFTAAQDIPLPRFTIPAGTWVQQDPAGAVKVCSFPANTELQGHLCAGGFGGSEGVQAAFYPSGALREFFAPQPVKIDGIPCNNSLFQRPIELYEDGHLRSATLNEDFSLDNQTFHKGERINLTPDGHVQHS